MPAPPFQFGQIVLLQLIFGDLSGSKLRPALVLHASADGDLLVVPITSHAPRSSFDVVVAHWRASGLRLPSTVRVDKVANVSSRLVSHTIGWLSAQDSAPVEVAVAALASTIAANARARSRQ